MGESADVTKRLKAMTEPEAVAQRLAASANHHHEVVAMDPALVRYNNMYVNRYKYFRWTPRTAWTTVAYVIAFPALIAYMGYSTEGKYEFRGKRRGDPIVEY